MRIKTVPRHRILQRNMKIASTTKISRNEEIVINVEQTFGSTHVINKQNPYQVYESPSTLIPVTMSAVLNRGLTLSSSTSASSSLTNDDNNNMEVKSGIMFQEEQVIGKAEEEEITQVVNLSTKDSCNRVDKIVAGTSADSENKLKDTFLYKIMTDPNFLENIQRNKQPKNFICLFCKKNFTTCEELTNHMDAKKNDNNQIVCCACKKTFAEKRYLKYHRRCHSEGTKFTCDICTRKYTRLDNLTRHNVLHVNPDKFSCTICSKTFTRKDLLNKHQKSHEKYNLYCEKCGKYFKRFFTLESHQKTHRKLSNTSVNTAFYKTDYSSSAEDVDCKIENFISTKNTVCKTANLTLGESFVCKTQVRKN